MHTKHGLTGKKTTQQPPSPKPHLSQKSQNNNVIVKLKYPGIPSTHFPWHLHTIKCKGQWYWNKERQFHSCAHTKASDPSYYSSLRHFLFLISRCSSFLFFFFFLLFFKEMTVDTSFTFSFSSAFSLHKAAVNVFCVWWEGNGTFSGGLSHSLHWWLK